MNCEPSPYQLLPPLSAAEYAALKADIRERGILVPVELDEQLNILDGHHRVRIWHELKAEGARPEPYARLIRGGLTEEEKRARVLALNLYRRHLRPEERGEWVAQIKRELRLTNAEIATLAGVDTATVTRDLHATCADAQVDPAFRIKGKDGKDRPARYRPRRPTTALATTPAGERQAAGAFASAPAEALPEGVVTAAKVAQAARPYLPRKEPAMDVGLEYLLPRAGTFTGVGDARRLELGDATMHLIVTSPPYGLDVGYEGGDVAPEDWPAFMREWLREALRVAVTGGRLALNVPLDTTRGGPRPTYAHAIVAAEDAGWTYRFSIDWHEDNISKTWARGSVDSPSAPHVIAPTELIAVFCKGEWKREGELPPDLTHAEWLEWTSGVWTFGGESRPYAGHPAAFPEELPRRLIKLLSFPGEAVLDPFMGSGTTPLVAWRLGRQGFGFDVSERYAVEASMRVVAGIDAWYREANGAAP